MTIEKIRELSNGQVVTYRTGRHQPDGIRPLWNDWQTGPIFVMKRPTNLRASLRRPNDRSWEKGSVLTLVPVNHAVAEFSEKDYDGNGVFGCEMHLLEIKL